MIAEEAMPPALMWELDHQPAPVPAATGADRLIRAVLEPQANALHVQLLRAFKAPLPEPGVEDRWLIERKAIYLGPSSLTKADRRVILEDPGADGTAACPGLDALAGIPAGHPGAFGTTAVPAPSEAPPRETKGRQPLAAA